MKNTTVPLRFVPLILTLRGSGKGSARELIRFISETFRLNRLLNLMVATMLLTTMLSQLTSTFLVSDLGPSPFLDNPRFENVPYGLQEAPSFDIVQEGEIVLRKYMESTDDVGYWTSGAAEYPIFAEYSELLPPKGHRECKTRA